MKFARSNPGKIGVGVWVKPLQEKVTPRLEKLIADNLDITYAIKLHLFHSKVSPVDERTICMAIPHGCRWRLPSKQSADMAVKR